MDEDFGIVIMAVCHSEEEAARVLESFSRAMAGLVLDGIAINLQRVEGDDDD